MVEYLVTGSAVEVHDGVPVQLKLQQRLDVPPEPFHAVSWRTRYPSGRSNRPFYWANKGGYWTLPVAVALHLMEKAEAAGLLDEKYDDAYARLGGGGATFLDSAALATRQRADLWREITHPTREPIWGAEPRFIVATEHGGQWRKIMILDESRRVVTFRSSTTNADYKPVLRLADTEWRMDNAMQDASTAIMRRFLTALRARG